jgi:hypothetical protein
MVVRTKLISFTNETYFEERLEMALREFAAAELVDIKFSTSAAETPTGVAVVYSALIIWREKNPPSL